MARCWTIFLFKAVTRADDRGCGTTQRGIVTWSSPAILRNITNRNVNLWVICVTNSVFLVKEFFLFSFKGFLRQFLVIFISEQFVRRRLHEVEQYKCLAGVNERPKWQAFENRKMIAELQVHWSFWRTVESSTVLFTDAVTRWRKM